MGFLPVDSSPLDLSGSSSSGLSSAGSRHLNHAIWDQLALLHWLRRNGPAFGADLSNVTLWALDSQASQLVQLLSLSRQAKGLFNTTKLTNWDQASFERLASQAHEAPAVRLKLASSLSQIVPSLTGQRAKVGQVAEFLERANLSKLAKLDQALERTADAAQLELARGPTMDDELLFDSPSRLLGKASTHSPADTRRQPIITRNLLSTHAGTELAFAIATNSTQEQVAYVSSSSRASPTAPAPSPDTSSQTGLRGFFAQAYKDAMGKALGVVVGTGLLIFLLNLFIVFLIAIRSARSRRQGVGQSPSQADESLPASTLLAPAKRSTLKRSEPTTDTTPTQNGSLRTGKQLKFASDLDAKANLELTEVTLANNTILLDPATLLSQQSAPCMDRQWQLNPWQDQLADKPGQLHNSLGSPTWNSQSQTTSSSAMILNRSQAAKRLLAPIQTQTQFSPGSSATLSNTPIQFLQSSNSVPCDHNELDLASNSPKLHQYTCDQVLSQPTFMLISDEPDDRADNRAAYFTCQHQHQSLFRPDHEQSSR